MRLVIMIAVLFVAAFATLGLIDAFTGQYMLRDWLAIFGPSYLMLLFAIAVIILVIVMIVTLVVSLLRWCSARLHFIDGYSDASATQLLAALGVVAVFFPTLLYAVFQAAIGVGDQLLVEAPRALFRVATQGYLCINGYAEQFDLYPPGPVTRHCVDMIFIDATSGFREIVTGVFFRSGLAGLNVPQLIFAIVLFALTTLAMVRLAPTMDAKARFWAAYSAIAILSIYLALSATLAVPLMNSPRLNAEQAAPTELRERLTALRPARTPIDAPDEPTETAQPARGFSDFETRLGVRFQGLNFILGEIDRDVADIRRRRDDLAENHEKDMDRQIESAVALYETEASSRLGLRETTNHYLSILEWFRRLVADQSQAVSDCNQALEQAMDAQRAARGVVAEMRLDDFVRQASENPTAFDRSALQDLIDSRTDDAYPIARATSDAIGLCSSVRNVAATPPGRPGYGTALGPVGFAMGWLLGAESMPVTLITGLVGFGLLGAMVGRFVRRPERAEEKDRTGEVAVVVFSGFVAALIVYLAAYGGIAIAAEDGGDPNPYVVFAACLVGAVYSTDVWDRARKRLFDPG